MASKKAVSTETPGAVSAAHDTIDDMLAKAGKAHDVIRDNRETLQASVSELQEKLAESVKAHAAEVAALKATAEREAIISKGKIDALEATLRKVRADLS